MEERDRAICVDFDVLTQNIERESRDWRKVLGDARIGNDHVKVVDTMLRLQLLDGLAGGTSVSAVDSNHNELAALSFGEGVERLGRLASRVADGGNNNVVGASEVGLDKGATKA